LIVQFWKCDAFSIAVELFVLLVVSHLHSLRPTHCNPNFGRVNDFDVATSLWAVLKKRCCSEMNRPQAGVYRVPASGLIQASRRFVQKPRAPLGFVDPNFDQARCGDVTMFVAHVMRFTQTTGQRFIVIC